MGGAKRRALGQLIVCNLCGCNRGPQEPQGTGATECTQRYFEALVRRDWPMAYAALDSPNQRRCSLPQFSRLAQSYCNSLGFEPSAVHIRACEERDAEATAHVVLTGQTASKDRRAKEAVTLDRGDDGWRVVLSQNIGRSKK
jgi:hypothetical protein